MFQWAVILKIGGFLVAVVVLGLTLYSPWLILETRAQAAGCLKNNLAEGLVTAFDTISGLGNPDGICISGAPAYISTNQAKIRTDTYEQLFDRYYKQSKSNKVQMSQDSSGYYKITPNFAITQNTLYYAKGDMLIDTDNPLVDNAQSRLGIFFVQGNLYISNNLKYGQNNPLAGLVFIVKGQINISSATQVTPQRIDAVLISEGGTQSGNKHSICTACDANGQSNSKYSQGTGNYDQRLIVSGGMISLKSDNNIKLLRTPLDTTVPAETIIADPKYLVILKDTISTTIKIWSEI